MKKLILLIVCLLCVQLIRCGDSAVQSDASTTTKTKSVLDDKKVILEARPVQNISARNVDLKRDLKQSESHVGILYPHGHFHHMHHPYYHHYGKYPHHYGHHYGHHHYGHHHYGHHYGHHLHHMHYMHHPYYYHHHYPYLHHHHHYKYPHYYPYHGIYGYNIFPNPFSLHYPLNHFNHYLSHLKHNPSSHYLSNHHSPVHPPIQSHLHNKCHCDCAKPHGYALNTAMHASKPYVGHHLSKTKPIDHQSVHHPLNGHYPINGHAISSNFQQPNYKINEQTHLSHSHMSNDKLPEEDKFHNKIDKTMDKKMDDKQKEFPKLPPNELMNQLIDFDLSYKLPKLDHPSLHSLSEDRYKRLIYGQFHEQNPISFADLYQTKLTPDFINDPFYTNHIPNTSGHKRPKPIMKKNKKKDLEHFQVGNGGQAQFLKMGIIK